MMNDERQCGWGDSNPHGFHHQILSLARLPLRHIRDFLRVQKYNFFRHAQPLPKQARNSSVNLGKSRLGGASKRRGELDALPYAPEGTLYRRSGVCRGLPHPAGRQVCRGARGILH